MNTACSFCEFASTGELKDELAACVRGLFFHGHVSSGGGNHSIRIPKTDRVLITPSGYPRSHLKAEDIVTIDLDGNVVEGTLKPTIEVPFHTEIYRSSSAGAVCHTHSPYIQALAISSVLHPTGTDGIFAIQTGEPLPKALKNKLPVLEYRQLGSRTLASLVGQACYNFAQEEDNRFGGAIVLLNHGVIGIGRCFHEAKFMVELLEEWAKCQLVASTLARK